jgi:hypothetical protein
LLLNNLNNLPRHNPLLMRKHLIPLVSLRRYGINVDQLKGLREGPQIGSENQRGAFVIVDVKETGCLNDTVRNRRQGGPQIGTENQRDVKETGCLNDIVRSRRLGPQRGAENQRAFVIVDAKETGCLNDIVRSRRLGGPQIGAENQRGAFVDVKETGCPNDTVRSRRLGGPQIGTENQRRAFVIVDVKEMGFLNDPVRNSRLGTDRLERRSPRVMSRVITHTSSILNDENLDCQASASFHITKLQRFDLKVY